MIAINLGALIAGRGRSDTDCLVGGLGSLSSLVDARILQGPI